MAAKRTARDADADMYSVQENAGNNSNVPAFLMKLWTLVEDPSNDDIICWDVKGKSFHIFDQSRFAHEVLPFYFKHNNISSFIRQLNMYGFRKVVKVEQGGLKVEHDDLEFQHMYFQRGQEQLLDMIKRRSAPMKAEPHAVTLNPVELTQVLTDVTIMKDKQENIASSMGKLKRENEALWREVALLRQKHAKQQQIVNKLLQFLLSLVNSRGTGGMAGLQRKRPLMINNTPHNPQRAGASPAKTPKIHMDESGDHDYTVESPAEMSASPSESRIVIQELMGGSPKMLVQNPNVPSPAVTTTGGVCDTAADTPTMSPGGKLSLLDQALLSANLLPQVSSPSAPSHPLLQPAPAYKQQPSVRAPPPSAAGVPLPASQPPRAPPLVAARKQLPAKSPAGFTLPSPSSSPAQGPSVGATSSSVPPTFLLPASPATQPASVGKSLPVASATQTTQTKPVKKDDLSSRQIALRGMADKPLSAASMSLPNNSDVTEQIELLQSDLDNLREALSSGQYSLDPSFLVGLFDPQSPLPVNLDQSFLDSLGADEPTSSITAPTSSGSITGQELWQYQPPDGLPDLFEELTQDQNDSQESDVFFGHKDDDTLHTPLPMVDDSVHNITAEDLD